MLNAKYLSLFVFLVVGVSSFASGQYYGSGFFSTTEQVINSIVENLEPLLRALLGGNDWTGYLLFEKTLLFLLITIMVGLILGNLPMFAGKKKGIIRLVAVIVGVLGVRNLNYIWINTIIVQYQVLFIAVAGILPFMIYWAFLKDISDGWVRKFAWIFYAVVYFGLWATTDLEAYADVYLWAALAALIYAFFIDSWLQRWLIMHAAMRGDHARRDALIGTIKKDIAEYQAQEAAGYLSHESARELIKRKSETIRSLLKG